MARVGTISIDLVARTGKLLKPLKRAERGITALKSKAASLGGMLHAKTLGPLLGLAAGAMTVHRAIAAVSQQFEELDRAAKMSDKVGMSTEALIGLGHAATLSGESVEVMNDTLMRLSKRVSEAAARGTGTAAKALQEIGLSAAELNNMTGDERLYAIADAMQGVGNQADKLRIAMELGGRSADALVQMTAGGSEGLRGMVEEAEKLGIAVNRQDAAKIEMANDAMARLKAVITGVARRIAVELAPFVTWLASAFVAAGTEGEGMAGKVRGGIDMVIQMIGHLLDAIDMIRTAFARAQLFVQQAAAGLVMGIAALLQGMEHLAEAAAAWVIEVFVKAQMAVQNGISWLVQQIANVITWIESKLPESMRTGFGESAQVFAEAFADATQQRHDAMREALAQGAHRADVGLSDLPMQFAREFAAEVQQAESQYAAFADREKLSDKLRRNVERIRREADEAAAKAAETPDIEPVGDTDLTTAAIERGSQAAFKAINQTRQQDQQLAEARETNRHLANIERSGVVLAGANLE